MIFVVVILCQLVVGAPILKSHLDGNDIETPSISQELFEQSPNTDEITFNFVKNKIYEKFSNATNKIALPTFDSNKVHEFITDNLDLVKGTQAALLMANYGGNIDPGSLVSLLQSAGAKGIQGFGDLLRPLY